MDPKELAQAVGALIIIVVFAVIIYPALTAATGQEVPFVWIALSLLIIAVILGIAVALRR